MATTTANLGLTLPASGENWNLATWNGNMTLIDNFVGGQAFMGRTALENDADFNSFTATTGGKDRFYYGGDIRNISNKPSGTFGAYPFILDVYCIGSYVAQKLIIYRQTPLVYYREQYWSGSSTIWGDWVQVMTSNNIVTLTNKFTFSSSEATQTINISEYIGYHLLAVYTNAGTVNVLGSQYVTDWNWNPVSGELKITRTSAGIWPNTPCNVVLIR